MFKNLNTLILGCIFLFVTPIIASDSVELEQSDHQVKLQTARVIVPRAVVYSDENMSSPLGYISADKLITVGNPSKNPELVPIIVYGRLAFIESKSIQFENGSIETQNARRGAPEHNIDILLSKPEEKFNENNSAYFSVHQFSAGPETKNLVNTVDGSTKNTFTGFDISMVHRQSMSKAFWGAGFEYNTLSTPNFKFDIYLISPIVGYTPIRNSLFLLDLSIALDISSSASLKILNNSVTEPSAFVWGTQLAARIILFPNQKYHAIASVGYRSYSVYGEKNLVDTSGADISGITKISGINLSIGFALEI